MTWLKAVQPVISKTRKAMVSGQPAMDEIARSAVSAHKTQLYCLFEVRWPSGRSFIGFLKGGGGKGIGPWVDVVVRLSDGEPIEVSSEDLEAEARRVAYKELPEWMRAMWPRDKKGKPLAQGYHDGRRVVGPEFFEKVTKEYRRRDSASRKRRSKTHEELKELAHRASNPTLSV